MDKLRAGIDTPNYPQLRDMNEMFFDFIQGVEKTSEGYIAIRTPTAKSGATIPEVDVLRRNASRIADLAEVERVRIKACVTGPYTLASFFKTRDARLFEDLGEIIAEIVSRTLFDSKKAEISLLFVDEPVFGFLNDPLLDYGSEGRKALQRAWETIFQAAFARRVRTGIHLHDTSDNLFWEIKNLDIVESHVNDPLYTSESTKRRLRETDKYLKASISVTIFDHLISNKLVGLGTVGNLQQQVGETWTGIRRGLVDPFTFLEEQKLMLSRLRSIVERFGSEIVRFAGPECGLWSFPSYECAVDCLRRISGAIAMYNEESKERKDDNL